MKRHFSLLCVGWPLGSFLMMNTNAGFQLWGAIMSLTALVLFLWFPSFPPKGDES